MKKENNSRRYALVALIGALVMLVLLFVDLFTKLCAQSVSGGKEGVTFEYFLGLVRFSYFHNTGIAYGLFNNNETAMIIVTVLTIVMILAIAVVFFTVFKRNTPVRIVLAVIEAGAIGNLVDRLILGYVRDFIDISKFGFGIANVADFYVVLGAVALVFILIFIGEDALFPLKKSWREAAKQKSEEKSKKLPKDESEAKNNEEEAEHILLKEGLRAEGANTEEGVDDGKTI